MRPFASLRVLVAGDAMLDEYVWGDAWRISPEAPVPVVEVRRRTYSLGGAANVAANIASLGARALLLAVTGSDGSGEILRRTAQVAGIDTSGVFVDPSRPTTTKSRIMAHQHQVARLDVEVRQPISRRLEQAVSAWLAENAGAFDACILSDYLKGFLPPRMCATVMRAARGVPVIVDPKAEDFRRYRGCTVVTPNLLEACRAARIAPGESGDLRRVGSRLLQTVAGAAVLITRGADGMSLFTAGGDARHLPSVARTVFDVTGAGDTAVATLALALAAGMRMEAAARMANRAAGIAVGKLGACGIGLPELEAALQEDSSAAPLAGGARQPGNQPRT